MDIVIDIKCSIIHWRVKQVHQELSTHYPIDIITLSLSKLYLSFNHIFLAISFLRNQ